MEGVLIIIIIIIIIIISLTLSSAGFLWNFPRSGTMHSELFLLQSGVYGTGMVGFARESGYRYRERNCFFFGFEIGVWACEWEWDGMGG